MPESTSSVYGLPVASVLVCDVLWVGRGMKIDICMSTKRLAATFGMIVVCR